MPLPLNQYPHIAAALGQEPEGELEQFNSTHLDALESRLGSQAAQSNQAQPENTDLQTQLTDLQAELTTLQSAHTTLQATHTTLQNQVASYQQQVIDAQAAALTAQNALNELRADYDARGFKKEASVSLQSEPPAEAAATKRSYKDLSPEELRESMKQAARNGTK